MDQNITPFTIAANLHYDAFGQAWDSRETEQPSRDESGGSSDTSSEESSGDSADYLDPIAPTDLPHGARTTVWEYNDADALTPEALLLSDAPPAIPSPEWVVRTSSLSVCMEHFHYSRAHAPGLWILLRCLQS